MKQLTILLVGVMAVFGVQAQPRLRPDDAFWKKRVVQRISLVEKANQALVWHMPDFFTAQRGFTETEGLIASLINGLEADKYVAYHPDDWNQPLSHEQLLTRMQDFEQALTGAPDLYEPETPAPFSGPGLAEEWNMPEIEGELREGEPELEMAAPQALDLSAYEQVVHLVEDWVFDAVRSEMMKVPVFFEVVWVDPGGMLPDKPLARFRWEDVRDQLDQTAWKNRFNDAETRSITEVILLGLYNGYMINVSGEGVRSLPEAEQRRQEMLEFEHHLWSY